MGEMLRIIVIEDSLDDADLLVRELRQGGYDPDWRRVATAEELSVALDEREWDAIVSDYHIPRFGGMGSLEIVRRKGLDIPFILVSGKVGEAAAVEAMKAGAHDFILKDNLSRLVPAIRRELAEAAMRRQHGKLVEELRASEERYRWIAETAQEGICTLDSEAKISFISSHLAELLGYGVEEMLGRPVFDFTEPGYITQHREQFVSRQRGEREVYDLCVVRKNGTRHWLLVSSVPIIDKDGRFQGSFAMITDINQRKEMEEALRASEEHYRRIVETSQEGMWVLNADGVTTYLNNRSAEIFGYSAEELIGRSVTELIDPDHLPEFREKFARRMLGNGEMYELCCRNKDGRAVWLMISATPIIAHDGRLQGSFAMVTDITELKETEFRLRQSEALFRNVTDQSLVGIYVIQDSLFRYANPKLAELTGYSIEEMLAGKIGYRDIILPDDLPDVEEKVQLRLSGELESVHYQFRVRRRDGEIVDFEVFGRSIDYNGRPAILGTALDVTERNRASEAVRQSRDYYLTLFQEFPALIWRSGTDAKCNYFNKAWLEFTGRTFAQEAGDGWAEGVHGDDFDACLRGYMAAFTRREPFTLNYRLRRHDGEYRWIIDYGQPFYDLENQFAGYIGVCYDFTEQRQAEEKQRHSHEQLSNLTAHLEKVREMERQSIAREIHDELGQSLTALKFDFSWLGKRLPDADTAIGNKLAEIAGIIDGTIKSVQRICSELRPRLLDDLGLGPAMEWLVRDMMRRTSIICSLKVDAPLDDLSATSSTALYRILQESLTNVIRHSEARRVKIHCWQEEEQIMLEVKDNGRGIARDQLESQTSYGIMGMKERCRICGGEVQFISSRGRGTTVRVTIPRICKEEP